MNDLIHSKAAPISLSVDRAVSVGKKCCRQLKDQKGSVLLVGLCPGMGSGPLPGLQPDWWLCARFPDDIMIVW